MFLNELASVADAKVGFPKGDKIVTKKFKNLDALELVLAIEHSTGLPAKELAERIGMRPNTLQKWKQLGNHPKKGPAKILLQLIMKELLLS